MLCALIHAGLLAVQLIMVRGASWVLAAITLGLLYDNLVLGVSCALFPNLAATASTWTPPTKTTTRRRRNGASSTEVYENCDKSEETVHCAAAAVPVAESCIGDMNDEEHAMNTQYHEGEAHLGIEKKSAALTTTTTMTRTAATHAHVNMNDTTEHEVHALHTLSEPRFVLHALLTPLLAAEALLLGRRAGAPWLAAPDLPLLAYASTGIIGILGLTHHLTVSRDKVSLLMPHTREPHWSWMRGLVACTCADSATPATLVVMLGPAICTCVVAIGVGIDAVLRCQRRAEMALGSDDDVDTRVCIRAGHVLWITAALELLSNAGPPWTAKLTGAVGECILIAGVTYVASILPLDAVTPVL